jgi:hypothetical protein
MRDERKPAADGPHYRICLDAAAQLPVVPLRAALLRFVHSGSERAVVRVAADAPFVAEQERISRAPGRAGPGFIVPS